jgi:hypothetical protein
MLFKLSTIVMLFGLLVTAPLSVALAAPKGPGGQACKSTGATTVDGTQDGNKVKCTADYCKYDECETSGPNIGKCFEKTHYTNVRDCKPAALSKSPQTPPLGTGGLKQIEPPATVPPRKGMPQVAPVMKQGEPLKKVPPAGAGGGVSTAAAPVCQCVCTYYNERRMIEAGVLTFPPQPNNPSCTFIAIDRYFPCKDSAGQIRTGVGFQDCKLIP